MGDIHLKGKHEHKNKKSNLRRNIILSATFIVLFVAGVFYAYKNKPESIKYGQINVESNNIALSSLNNMCNYINNSTPGIKASITTNDNDSDLFYKMLNGEIDIIAPYREMDESELQLATNNNISYKQLPIGTIIDEDGNNKILYIYINDMNYNHKPENKLFAKSYFNNFNEFVDTNNMSQLSNEEYIKVYDYLTLIDEF